MGSPRPLVHAYYYAFELTGVEPIDRILTAIARAGKGLHSTEGWNDPYYGEPTYIERIQEAADAAADAFTNDELPSADDVFGILKEHDDEEAT